MIESIHPSFANADIVPAVSFGAIEDISRDIESLTAAAARPLTESQLWQIVAAHASENWREAKSRLEKAEAAVADHFSHANRPLGAIGRALEGERTLKILRTQTAAQADFTIFDEALRNDDTIQSLFQEALARQRLIEDSLGLSTIVKVVDIDTALPDTYSKLQRNFGAFAKRLFKTRTQAQERLVKP